MMYGWVILQMKQLRVRKIKQSLLIVQDVVFILYTHTPLCGAPYQCQAFPSVPGRNHLSEQQGNSFTTVYSVFGLSPENDPLG